MLRSRSHRQPFEPQRGFGRRCRLAAAAWLLTLAGAAVADDAAAPASAGGSDAVRPPVVTVVAGIVSYTRWPEALRSVRLCAFGKGLGVDELLAGSDLGSPQLSVVVRARTAGAAIDECDVVYVGVLPDDALRRLLRAATGRPVLLIGEGAEFCADGGMFCLHPGAQTAGFAVNLDAVARSGLKVNPRVLRIARQPEGGS